MKLLVSTFLIAGLIGCTINAMDKGPSALIASFTQSQRAVWKRNEDGKAYDIISDTIYAVGAQNKTLGYIEIMPNGEVTGFNVCLGADKQGVGIALLEQGIIFAKEKKIPQLFGLTKDSGLVEYFTKRGACLKKEFKEGPGGTFSFETRISYKLDKLDDDVPQLNKIE